MNPVDILIGKKAIEDFDVLIAKTIKAQEEILKLGNIALDTSKNFKFANTPSGVTANGNNAQNITASLNQQTEALRKLETQKLKVAKATAEETVNNGLLNRNAKEQVVLNSQLATSYEKLNTQHKLASRNLQDLVVRGKLSTQTQREYNRELKVAQADFNKLNARVISADKAVGRFNRNVGNYPSRALGGIKDLIGAFGIVGGVTLFAQITKDIFDQTKQIQALDLALKQVSGTQEQFASSQAFLLRVSEQYGVGINELTKSYTQFYVSAKDKLKQADIEGIFESISKAAGAMGLSVDQQQGAFLALTQMLSKGTIQAEELRGQLSERLPGSFGILAKSMGVTEKVLGDMLKKGQVMASEVLPKFAKELEKAYGIENLKRVESLNASTTRLSNAWTNLIRSLNEGGGTFSNFLQTGINNMTIALGLLERLFTSSEKLRKSFLEGQKEQGTTNAKQVLSQFKDADEKTAYANEAIIKTRAEIAKNTAEFNRLKKENADINAKTTTNSREVFQDQQTLKANEEKIKSLNELIYKQVGYVKGLKSILAEENKVVEKSKESDADKELRLKKEDEYAKQKFNTRKKELELELQVIDRTLDDEDMFYQERLRALELHRLKRLEIISLQYNEETRIAKGNNELQKQALLDYHSSVLTEIDNFNKKEKSIKGISSLGIKQQEIDLEKELQQTSEKGIELAEREAKALKDKEENLIALKKATDEYIKSFSDSFLGSIGLGALDKFFDGTFDRLLEGADTLQEKFAVTFLAITDVAKQAFAFINQASQANFDAEYNRLELQKEVAIKFAGESTTAQEAVNEEYERRRKAIARREAESKKDLAIFNSIINTAQGVTSALASANIPLAITIGILGAIQTGFIASQEIPQFFDGGTHKGGLMLVNDGKGSNYKETIVTPNGKVINPTSRNVLMDAPKGTQIFNANQTKERDAYLQSFLQERGISMNFQPKEQSGLSTNDFNNGISRLERTMSNSSSGSIVADKKGISLWKLENGRRTKVLNNRLHVRK